jgi:hypothetical protein
MPYYLSYYNDTLADRASLTFPKDGIHRLFYVHQGDAEIDGQTVSADEAVYRSGSATVTGAGGGARAYSGGNSGRRPAKCRAMSILGGKPERKPSSPLPLARRLSTFCAACSCPQPSRHGPIPPSGCGRNRNKKARGNSTSIKSSSFSRRRMVCGQAPANPHFTVAADAGRRWSRIGEDSRRRRQSNSKSSYR